MTVRVGVNGIGRDFLRGALERVAHTGNRIVVGGKTIRVTAERDPSAVQRVGYASCLLDLTELVAEGLDSPVGGKS